MNNDYIFAGFVIVLSGAVLAGVARFAIAQYFQIKKNVIGTMFEGPLAAKEN